MCFIFCLPATESQATALRPAILRAVCDRPLTTTGLWNSSDKFMAAGRSSPRVVWRRRWRSRDMIRPLPNSSSKYKSLQCRLSALLVDPVQLDNVCKITSHTSRKLQHRVLSTCVVHTKPLVWCSSCRSIHRNAPKFQNWKTVSPNARLWQGPANL